MSKSLAIVGKSYLRPGQRKLYELIVEKLKTEDKIILDEAEHIWLSRVHSNMINGIPHRTAYDVPSRYDERGMIIGWTSRDVAMTQEEVTERVLMWLTSTIGILVIRGYLKVIPMIDIKHISTGSPV